jgi:ATP-dependent DNA helicase RecG
MPALPDPVRFLRGVGPHMAGRLERLGIRTIRDLLFHLPVAYRDRREVTSIAGLTPGAEASVLATVARLRPVRRMRGRSDLEGTLRDESGFLRAIWFNQAYRERTLEVGGRYLFSGTVQAFRGLELHNPEFEPADAPGPRLHVGLIAPRYALTEGVQERWLRARVRAALDELPDVPEVIPEEWRARFGLPSLAVALERAHFPATLEDVAPAKRRVALEEILALQVALEHARRKHRGRRRAESLAAGAEAAERFLESLPLEPTGAQRRAIEAIAADLDREVPMRRLLLGDVGSGKTLVALAAAARAAAAGHQAAILAPTSVLAEQHAVTAERLLAPSGIGFALLTSATPPAARDHARAGFASGEIPVAIGTHALLERDLSFRSLALVVVDEQHRFGVRQRVTLTAPGEDGRAAHLLVLTATPIPRSLAMTLYGDLDLSVLDEKPPGRLPVETTILPSSSRRALLDLLAEEVSRNGSAFVVYPVVEDGESAELRSATTMAGAIAADPRLAAAGVALVHGRLPVEERRASLLRFRRGEARVLVATTVIEVGLDVPEATLVVIEHPERFGLAQLHQLRGRVGRADRPGRCVLVPGEAVGDAGRARLRVFQTVSDGFRLAEEDLRLRGPGEFLGTSQHGFPELRAVDLMRDADLLEAAREWSGELLDRAGAEGGAGATARWIQSHFPEADRYLGSG